MQKRVGKRLRAVKKIIANDKRTAKAKVKELKLKVLKEKLVDKGRGRGRGKVKQSLFALYRLFRLHYKWQPHSW